MKDGFKIGIMIGTMLVLLFLGYLIGFNKGVVEAGEVVLPSLESMQEKALNLTEKYYDCRDERAEYKYATDYWRYRYEDLKGGME